MKETGLHITFPGGKEVWIEFDGESYCDNSLAPIISEDVVFFGKGKKNWLKFTAWADAGDDRATIDSWSLVAKDG